MLARDNKRQINVVIFPREPSRIIVSDYYPHFFAPKRLFRINVTDYYPDTPPYAPNVVRFDDHLS